MPIPIDRKKKVFKLWCTNRSMESKINYRKARNETKKVISRAMKQEAEEEMNVLCTKPNDLFKVCEVHEKGGKRHREEVA